MDVDAVAARSLERLTASMPEHGRLVEDGTPTCPWCESELEVRLTTLSPYDEERGIYNDEVYLKCAGQDGCAFLPLFHAVMDEQEYQTELQLRDGQRRVDVAQARDDPADVEAKLRALGYME